MPSTETSFNSPVSMDRNRPGEPGPMTSGSVESTGRDSSPRTVGLQVTEPVALDRVEPLPPSGSDNRTESPGKLEPVPDRMSAANSKLIGLAPVLVPPPPLDSGGGGGGMMIGVKPGSRVTGTSLVLGRDSMPVSGGGPESPPSKGGGGRIERMKSA